MPSLKLGYFYDTLYVHACTLYEFLILLYWYSLFLNRNCQYMKILQLGTMFGSMFWIHVLFKMVDTSPFASSGVLTGMTRLLKSLVPGALNV